MTDAPQLLAGQWLTPERLRWVLDISESTLTEWQRKRLLTGFKCGRVVRYAPEVVLEFILRHTTRTPGHGTPGTNGTPGLTAEVWAQINRLIQDQVAAAMKKEECRMQNLPKAA